MYNKLEKFIKCYYQENEMLSYDKILSLIWTFQNHFGKPSITFKYRKIQQNIHKYEKHSFL